MNLLLKRYLGRLLGVGLLLLIAWFAVNYIDQAGFDRGYAAAEKNCQQADIDRLVITLKSAAEQTEVAQAENLRLSSIINQQMANNASTTEELRDALTATAADRAACRFNADIMRQLKQARDRAAKAATGGFTDPVPDSSGTGK
ncbi:hypothetical protein [Neptuniibacter sp.]|uniref:hypothetical protein n=1 Tax=Neptuniibacter sp. TaxID=1962643 RepID=UPI003B5AF926